MRSQVTLKDYVQPGDLVFLVDVFGHEGAWACIVVGINEAKTRRKNTVYRLDVLCSGPEGVEIVLDLYDTFGPLGHIRRPEHLDGVSW